MPYSEDHCIITFSGDTVVIEGKCLITDKMQRILAKAEDYEKWINGEDDIRILMPYLTDSEMNFLSNGTTDDGWQKITIPNPLK